MISSDQTPSPPVELWWTVPISRIVSPTPPRAAIVW
jgi:hypothetical protein